MNIHPTRFFCDETTIDPLAPFPFSETFTAVDESNAHTSPSTISYYHRSAPTSIEDVLLALCRGRA